MSPQNPYLLGGTVHTSAGVASSGTTVTLVYEDLGETLATTTDSQGHYVFDLSNLSSYEDLDFVTIIASGSASVLQDLRMKLVARSAGQISIIKVEYET